MTTMKKAIVAGLGGRGLHWVNRIAEHPGIEIVGYVEPVETMRTRAVEKHNIAAAQIHETLEAAIGSTSADFVVDVTPPSEHRTVAETVFAHGLHLLGEKPVSDNWDDAVRAVKAGIAADRRHMITQNYRFGAFPRTTRRVLAEGKIGKPGQCDLRFYMPWADIAGSHYVTQPYMLINDMMVHHFDLMRYVLGEEPSSVHAITWNQPWGWHAGDAAHAIVFKYPSGLVATHVSCGCAVGSQTSWNGDWRIEGPDGSIEWQKDKMVYDHLHRTPNRVEERIFGDNVPGGERAILDEFIASIDEKREPECSGRDNLKSLAMVFGAIKSAKEGRTVELNEFAGL